MPWSPPKTELPAKLLTATTALFEAGLADPRGGEYRIIEIGTGNCWSGDGGIVRTHGWVLPERAGEKQRFAVAWNGLVYPVVTVGERARLRADVLALVDADKQARAKAKNFYRFRHAWAEGHSVSFQSMLPIKACLLLRLGEEDLARWVWEGWTAGMRANTNDDDLHLRDPYLMLATDWVWAQFDRAVCAHMRGDDRLALLDARALVRIHRTVETQADDRGFARADPGRDGKACHLRFLGELPALLADQERRASRKADPAGPPAKEKDQQKRIRGLIRELENVGARQWGQPGGVSFELDGSLGDLVKEGEAAVEPLLKCLEEDERLTRSVQFHRDFFHYRGILGVREAACAALTSILHTSSFGVEVHRSELGDPAARKKLVDAIRAYWNRVKHLPVEERWYVILGDDKATLEQWLEAADSIVRRGQVLRKKKDPSVTDLLIRRIDALATFARGSSTEVYRAGDACRMVDHLAGWDLDAALPVLRKQTKAIRDYLAIDDILKPLTRELMAPALVRFVRKRIQAGDRTALDEYADWIKTVGPQDASHSFLDLLEPMWENPDYPAIVAAAKALFGDDASPWTKKFFRTFATRDLLTTPLAGLPIVRKRLLAELEDKGPAGKVTCHEHSESLETEGYSSGYGSSPAGDPLAPKPGTVVPFRVCDYYAWRISQFDGAPRCQLYWSEAERDKGVSRCVAFLKQYGERLKFCAAFNELPDSRARDGGRVVFPRLDRPATAEDVRAGRAIFSLADEGKVRLVKLPAVPMKAKWLTYKGVMRSVQFWDSRRNRAGYRMEPEQDGLVWQAEEVLKDGKWVRYYGFVGCHVMARVPAAEIEFPVLTGADDEEKALAVLQKAGARVERDKEKRVVGLVLAGGEVSDETLGVLRSLPQLESLQLVGTHTTDKGLEVLGSLKKLRQLNLDGALLTDQALVGLKGLTELQALRLGNTAITDAGLANLQGLKKLQTLHLVGIRITDKGLTHLADLKEMQNLDLRHTALSDAGLTSLEALTGLRSLRLGSTKISDGGLAALKKFASLEVLDLASTRISDAGLAQLESLTHLRTLSLADTAVSDAGLVRLGKLEALRSLDLARTKVTGTGLVHLKGLRELSLAEAPVTDRTLEPIAGLTGLEQLDLRFTSLTDAGVSHLKGLTVLKKLDLWKVPISDAGLGQLKGLRKLEKIELGGAKITKAGLDDFQKAVPGVQIGR
jgi:Leucine-rich repeat (LRR) protein